MSAKYKSPSFLLPNELNTSANTANDTGINSLYSMSFPGNSGSATLGGLTSTIIQGDLLTISCWYYPTNVGSSDYIIGSGSTTYGPFTVERNTSNVRIRWKKSSGTNPVNITTTDSPLQANVWYHICGVFDTTNSTATDKIQIWINGVRNTTGDTSLTGSGFGSSGASTDTFINKFRTSPSSPSVKTNSVDELAFFNKALTSTEIAALYGGTSPNIYPSNLMAANLNPIAYYPLGEQAQNTGYLDPNNPGSDISGSEWQFPNGVLQDYVMDFDGSSDFIDTNLTIDSTYSALTISAWVNFDNLTNYSTVLGQWRNDSFPNSTVLLYLDNTSKIQVLFGSGSSYVSAGLNTTLQTNRWYNLIVLWDGSTVKLYVDGSVQSTTGSLSSLNNSDVTLKIGSYNEVTGSGTRNYIDGKISNVVVWNSDQSANVANIYNNGSPQTSYTVTPQNWWKLNADSVYTPSAPNYTTALDFNGTNNYVNAGRVLSAENTSTLSVSYWLKVESSFFGTAVKGIIGYFIGNFTAGWQLNASHNNLYFIVGDASTGWQAFFIPENSITAGEWNHFTMVYDGSQTGSANRLKVYLNGTQPTLSGTPTFPSSIPTLSTAELTIGALSPTLYPGGAKTISNVVVYNSALTSSQVSTLFNFGTPEVTPSFSPQAWWKLDNTTTGIQDSSGNGYNGANSTNSATVASTSVAVVPSWKIPSALPITTTPNYTTALDFVGGTTAGSGHSIDISSYTGLSNTSAFTVSIWFKGEDFSTDWIFSTSIAGDFGNNVIGLDLNNSGQLRPNILFNGTSANISNVDIDLNKWYHAAITYDGSTGIATMYVNTVAYAGTNNLGSTTPTFSNNLVIAALEFRVASPSLGYYFDGLLSNMAIFNTALPATGSNSIEALYNNGTPLVSMSSFSSLQAWWKLDNLATGIQDSSGNGYNGSNSGATQVTSDVLAPQPVNGVSTTLPSTALQQSDLQFDSPYSNYSLSFDGTGDYIDTNYIFPTISTWSYSYWVNITDPGNSNYFYQVTARNSSTQGLIIWSGNGSTSSQRNFSIRMENSATMTFSVSSFNTWYHIVVTGDGSNLTAYVDGLQVATLATSTLFSTLTYTTKIGSNKDGTNYFLNGKIDETSIFNYALSDAQILEIYNNGKPGNLDNFSGTAPINWWRLGENAYFDNNAFTVPNSISGAPNGTGAGTVTSMLTADAPGTYANGVGTNLDIVDRVGDAALSVANSQSYNMIPSDISPYVPEYVGDQISNTYSMTFDGVDDYITVSQINLGTTNTISLWYNGEVINYCALLGNDDAPNDYAVWVNNGTTVSYKVQDASNGVVDWNVTNVNDGNWHHFAFSRTNTTINFYIDGNLQTVNSNNLANNDTKIDTIGAKTNGSYPFKGKLDEVAIFNTALNAGQIYNDIYQPTKTGTNQTADLDTNPNLPTPVAWYRMGD